MGGDPPADDAVILFVAADIMDEVLLPRDDVEGGALLVVLVPRGSVWLVEAPVEEVWIFVRRILGRGQSPVVSSVLLLAPGAQPSSQKKIKYSPPNIGPDVVTTLRLLRLLLDVAEKCREL